MTIDELLRNVDTIISDELKNELRAQGHYNTGKLDQSINGKISKSGKKNLLIGTAPYYAMILHHGFGPEKASFKQVPFLTRYFASKGYSAKDAKSFAFATVKKWMVTGMPTPGSFAYSQNGQRLNVVSIVKRSVNGKVNTTMSNGLDKIVNQKFKETKSETV